MEINRANEHVKASFKIKGGEGCVISEICLDSELISASTYLLSCISV